MSTADSWGVLPACEILRAIDTTRRLRRAINSTAAIDEDAVTILQNHLFVFADVMRLNDRELQTLLNRVANKPLAKALSDAPDAVRDRLLSNMSPRRSQLVGEELEYLGELEPEEIAEDQREILETLRRLYESGQIATYFGSIRGDGDTSAELPDELSDREGAQGAWGADDAEGEAEPELGARPAAAAHKKERSATKKSARPMLLALGAVAGTGLVTLVVFLVAQMGDGDPSRPQSAVAEKPSRNRLNSQILAQGQALSDSSSQTQPPTPSDQDADVPENAAGEISAVLEFAGTSGQTAAEVRVDEGSQLEEEEDAPADSAEAGPPGDLYLRMGRVSCAVVSETDTFVVRSPLVVIRGLPGAVFAVQVVLDASTTVFVEHGRVEVAPEDRAKQAKVVVLRAGERRRFEP